jgi:hypothetical protein
MKYALFIYKKKFFIIKDDLSSEYFMFEEKFGSPFTSGTLEEMINYSLDINIISK